MSSPPKPIPEAQAILGASRRKVLVVEGATDKAIYAKWLDKLASPNPASATVELVAAGGKDAVLRCLRWFADQGGEPRVFGLVDRDEWDATTTTQQVAELPQLRVNPDRHAIESYFCDPQEIWSTLLLLHPGWASEQATFEAQVDGQREDHVQHWALLTVTDRLKNRMNEQGYPGHFSTTVPIPPDAEIQARFQQWSQTLDPQAGFQDFTDLRQAALAASPTVQFRSHVWAKLFFERVVHPALNALPTARAQTPHDWMIDLVEQAAQIPADIAGMLSPLL